MSRGLLTRRAAVQLIAISSIFLPSNWAFRLLSTGAEAKLIKKITDFYSHKEDAAIIGFEYLNSAPDEFDIHNMIDLICSHDAQRYKQLTEAKSDEARAIIARWQREDFESGRIVRVSGWLLSETETRVCALTALTMTDS